MEIGDYADSPDMKYELFVVRKVVNRVYKEK